MLQYSGVSSGVQPALHTYKFMNSRGHETHGIKEQARHRAVFGLGQQVPGLRGCIQTSHDRWDVLDVLHILIRKPNTYIRRFASLAASYHNHPLR